MTSTDHVDGEACEGGKLNNMYIKYGKWNPPRRTIDMFWLTTLMAKLGSNNYFRFERQQSPYLFLCFVLFLEQHRTKRKFNGEGRNDNCKMRHLCIFVLLIDRQTADYSTRKHKTGERESSLLLLFKGRDDEIGSWMHELRLRQWLDVGCNECRFPIK